MVEGKYVVMKVSKTQASTMYMGSFSYCSDAGLTPHCVD